MRARRILIALDKSDNSHRALRYCTSALRGVVGENNEKLLVTLFLVEFMPQRHDGEALSDWEKRCHDTRAGQKAFLNEAVELLVAEGVPNECIRPEYVSMGDGCVPYEDSDWRTEVAERIIREQRQQRYDTLVMGRRSVSKTEAYLFGSVTRKVLERVRDCVVWLVC